MQASKELILEKAALFGRSKQPRQIVYKGELLTFESPLEKIIQYALEEYYLKPYPKAAPVNGVFRPLHGFDHVIRAAIAIEFLVYLYQIYFPEGLLRPQRSSDVLPLNSIDGMDLKILRLAAVYHDCANTSECFHEEKKHAEIFESDMQALGFPDDLIKLVADGIENKDKAGEKNVYQRLIHDADWAEFYRIFIAKLPESDVNLQNLQQLEKNYFLNFRKELSDFKLIIEKNNQQWNGSLQALEQFLIFQKHIVIVQHSLSKKVAYQTLPDIYSAMRKEALDICIELRMKYPNTQKSHLLSAQPDLANILFCGNESKWKVEVDNHERFNEATKNKIHKQLVSKYASGQLLIRRIVPTNNNSRVADEITEIQSQKKFRPATLVIKNYPIVNYTYPNEWTGVIIDAEQAEINHVYKANAQSNQIGQPNFKFERTPSGCKDIKSLASLREKLEEMERRRNGEIGDAYNAYTGRNIILHSEVLLRYQAKDVLGIVVGNTQDSAKDALSIYKNLHNSAVNFYYYSSIFGFYRLSLIDVHTLVFGSSPGRQYFQTFLENKYLNSLGLTIHQQLLQSLVKNLDSSEIQKEGCNYILNARVNSNTIFETYICSMKNGIATVAPINDTATFYDNTYLLTNVIRTYQKRILKALLYKLSFYKLFIKSRYGLSKFSGTFRQHQRRSETKDHIEFSIQYSESFSDCKKSLVNLFNIHTEEKCFLNYVGLNLSPILIWQVRTPSLIEKMLASIYKFEDEIKQLLEAHKENAALSPSWFASLYEAHERNTLLYAAKANKNLIPAIFKQLLYKSAYQHCEKLLAHSPTLNTSEVTVSEAQFNEVLTNRDKLPDLFKLMTKNRDWFSAWENDDEERSIRLENIIYSLGKYLNNRTPEFLFNFIIKLFSQKKWKLASLIVDLMNPKVFKLKTIEGETLLHIVANERELSLIKFLIKRDIRLIFERNYNNVSVFFLALESDVQEIYEACISSLDFQYSGVCIVTSYLMPLIKEGRHLEANGLMKSKRVTEYFSNEDKTIKAKLAEGMIKHGCTNILENLFLDTTERLTMLGFALKLGLNLLLKHLNKTLIANLLPSDVDTLVKLNNHSLIDLVLRELDDPAKKNVIKNKLIDEFINAIRKEDLDKVKLFLLTDLNIFSQGKDGHSPFEIAFTECDINSEVVTGICILKNLKKWQANLAHCATLPPAQRTIPLDVLLKSPDSSFYVDQVNFFYSPTGKPYHGTALHAAIIWGQEASVKTLLKFNSNIHALTVTYTNGEVTDCLSLALKYKSSPQITEMLMNVLAQEHYLLWSNKISKTNLSFFAPVELFFMKQSITKNLEKILKSPTAYNNFWVTFCKEVSALNYCITNDQGSYISSLLENLINKLLELSNHDQLVKQLVTYKVCMRELLSKNYKSEQDRSLDVAQAESRFHFGFP